MKKQLYFILLAFVYYDGALAMFSGWFGGKKPDAIYTISDSKGNALGVDKVTTKKTSTGQNETHALHDLQSNHLGDFIISRSTGMIAHEIKSKKGSPLFNQLVQAVAEKNDIKLDKSFDTFRLGTPRKSEVTITELSEEEARKLEQSGTATVSSSKVDTKTSPSATTKPTQSTRPETKIPTKNTYESGLTIEEISDDLDELIRAFGLELALIRSLHNRL